MALAENLRYLEGLFGNLLPKKRRLLTSLMLTLNPSHI